jgi:hypothetical protein
MREIIKLYHAMQQGKKSAMGNREHCRFRKLTIFSDDQFAMHNKELHFFPVQDKIENNYQFGTYVRVLYSYVMN